MFEVQTDFRNESMSRDDVIDFLVRTYHSCFVWDGMNGEVIVSRDQVRAFIASRYIVVVTQTRFEARHNLPALCQVSREQDFMEWAAQKSRVEEVIG